MMELLGATACKETSLISEVCTNSLFLIGGFHEENVNKTLLPDIMATTPAGCSVNQILHYLQEYNSGYYREWDYGSLRNKKEYKDKKPPIYPVSNIKAEMYWYYSDNDYLAAVADVHKLAKEVPSYTIKKLHHVTDPKFTHIDFLWGLNVKSMVYNHLIKNLG